jgi:hypothetical protein
MSGEMLGKSKEAIESLLPERFTKVNFEFVKAFPHYDEDDYEYVLVHAVFDDKGAWPDTNACGTFIRQLRPTLEGVGTEASPVMSCIANSEYRHLSH